MPGRAYGPPWLGISRTGVLAPYAPLQWRVGKLKDNFPNPVGDNNTGEGSEGKVGGRGNSSREREHSLVLGVSTLSLELGESEDLTDNLSDDL